ncbi:unnamed protein product [Paramecium octaurelia]|uniref:Uncharacterized protein n=1 Tax=Paramecium octaurelia TaxID=43137 RepID=A0A8S1SZ88_PAROT|nr:unnamed protein product [Paramecium octaurelia]
MKSIILVFSLSLHRQIIRLGIFALSNKGKKINLKQIYQILIVELKEIKYHICLPLSDDFEEEINLLNDYSLSIANKVQQQELSFKCIVKKNQTKFIC